MEQSLSDRLNQAAQHIKANRIIEAQKILVDVVLQYPGSEQGWYLYSLTVGELYQQVECLEHVLRINPSNTAARIRLSKIKSTPEYKKHHPEGEYVSPFTNSEPFAPQRVVMSGEEKPADEEPLSTAPAVDETPKPPETTPQAAQPKRRVWIIPLVVVVALAVVAALLFGLQLFGGQVQPADTLAAVTAIGTPLPLRTLPPTWTPSPTASPQPTPTRTPLPTETPVPTPLPLAEADAAALDAIFQQAAGLRGLPAPQGIGAFLVNREQANQRFRVQAVGGSATDLARDKNLLAALGLLKSSHDIPSLAFYRAQGIYNALYLPEDRAIYVSGIRLGAIERMVFVHQYGYALRDNAACRTYEDGCLALSALYDGDATLLARQWVAGFASVEERQEIARFQPQPVTDASLPPFAPALIAFPANYGVPFVEMMYAQGGWQAVNKLYEEPPLSSEQVMHPEKYAAAEAPLALPETELAPLMGGGWELSSSGTIGEWLTLQMLASPAGSGETVDLPAAQQAAAGWGGDRYQLHTRASDNAAALSVLWEWDTLNDQAEFAAALMQQLELRYGDRLVGAAGESCWSGDEQSGCLYLQGKRVLWLLAPDLETVRQMAAAFPELAQ